MSLKDMTCPNCGASLKFNSKTHYYECEYCKSTFKDTKAGSYADSRVELTPEELETMKPIKKSSSSNNEYKSLLTLFIVVGVIILVVVIGTVSMVSWMSYYADEQMDDYDDFDFDDDYGNSNFGNNNWYGNNNFGNGGYGSTIPPYWWYD